MPVAGIQPNSFGNMLSSNSHFLFDYLFVQAYYTHNLPTCQFGSEKVSAIILNDTTLWSLFCKTEKPLSWHWKERQRKWYILFQSAVTLSNFYFPSSSTAFLKESFLGRVRKRWSWEHCPPSKWLQDISCWVASHLFHLPLGVSSGFRNCTAGFQMWLSSCC